VRFVVPLLCLVLRGSLAVAATLPPRPALAIETAIAPGELGPLDRDIFVRQISGRRAWRVTSTDDDLSWSDGTETFSNDPHSSPWQRTQAWMVCLLGIEAQL
jgi:hypothetical protein